MTAAESLRTLANFCERHGVECAISARTYQEPTLHVERLEDLQRLAPDAIPSEPWTGYGGRCRIWRGAVDGIVIEAVEYLPLHADRGAL